MSTPGNVTSASSGSPAHASLLWIPYVLIALVFIVFLGANFWCYHKKHRERYLRKRDEKRVKDGLHERRRITALMRSHFQSAFMSKSNDDGDEAGKEEQAAAMASAMAAAAAAAESGEVQVSQHHQLHHGPPDSLGGGGLGGSVDKLLSPGGGGVQSQSQSQSPPGGELPPAPLWTGHNGSCRTSGGGVVVCAMKSETSNGSVLH